MKAVAGLWCKTILEFAFMCEASHFLTSIENLKAFSVLFRLKTLQNTIFRTAQCPKSSFQVKKKEKSGHVIRRVQECIQPTVNEIRLALDATKCYQVRPIPRFLEHFSRSKTQKNPVVSFSFRVSSFPSIASLFNLSFTIHTHFTLFRPFDLPASKSRLVRGDTHNLRENA
ncbi:hypothetical protein METSCH_B09560 [Metschnikowia aff. pulcherrima]|uniref:Uncharacterized protein n=1 Tax=Metschnikowia aff. pulcherrima TaxID=2163413 RepID=A0A4P6XMF3_9ASCO|nr:hypothetical protein METSCH_B09560 [Metschnikowia aff. pulcherrima]